jgi:hypothetical protein
MLAANPLPVTMEIVALYIAFSGVMTKHYMNETGTLIWE